jgi:protein arginine N-methyltransferase 3
MDFDDEWSDDEEPVISKDGDNSRVRQLESELEKARNDVKRLQNLVQEMTNDDEEVEETERIVLGPGVKSGQKGKGKAVLRDDDTHYFDSYEHNGESLRSS